MLVELKRIVAYICPFCSNISSKALSVFNFSGTDTVRLICPTHGCHETCVSIQEKGTKYKLDIECPLCGDSHSYAISRESFWNKPLITYKCPAAGIDIFFAGEKNKVEKMLDENTDMFSDFIDDIDDNEPFDLMYLIIERIHLLQSSHNVSCTCGSEDIGIDIANGNIALFCRRCKKTKFIASTEDSLTRILNANSIVIGN